MDDRFNKLTSGQYKPLFDVVKHQRNAGDDKVITYQFSSARDLDDFEIIPSGGRDEDRVTVASTKVFDTWKNSYYVDATSLGYGGYNFILTSNAFDYYDWMQQNNFKRNLRDFLRHPMVTAVIGAVVGSVITAIILSTLNLTCPP